MLGEEWRHALLNKNKKQYERIMEARRESGSCGFCLCYLTCIEVLLACELYEQDERTVPLSGDTRWGKARALFLKQHPLCVSCQAEGKIVPATVVDHIIPHRGDQQLFWDQSNWQPLCKGCHDKKTGYGF